MLNRCGREDITIPSNREESKSIDTQEQYSLSADDILSEFPKTLCSAAKTLLDIVERNEKLGWNVHGEFIVNGKAINGSRVKDIINDALAQYNNLQPIGLEEFYSNLETIPLSLIKNSSHSLLQQKGSGTAAIELSNHIPPPTPPSGVPNKKRGRRVKEG